MTDLFSKILIATDGSKYTQDAIREGLAIARAHGSQVYALYVIDTRALATAPGMPEPENIYQLLEEEGKVAVGQVKAAASDARAGPVPVETFVLSGHPSAVITKFARDRGVSLIVVGTLGKSGIEELLLGSVADKVIRTAPCPVLVVKSEKH